MGRPPKWHKNVHDLLKSWIIRTIFESGPLCTRTTLRNKFYQHSLLKSWIKYLFRIHTSVNRIYKKYVGLSFISEQSVKFTVHGSKSLYLLVSFITDPTAISRGWLVIDYKLILRKITLESINLRLIRWLPRTCPCPRLRNSEPRKRPWWRLCRSWRPWVGPTSCRGPPRTSGWRRR